MDAQTYAQDNSQHESREFIEHLERVSNNALRRMRYTYDTQFAGCADDEALGALRAQLTESQRKGLRAAITADIAKAYLDQATPDKEGFARMLLNKAMFRGDEKDMPEALKVSAKDARLFELASKRAAHQDAQAVDGLDAMDRRGFLKTVARGATTVVATTLLVNLPFTLHDVMGGGPEERASNAGKKPVVSVETRQMRENLRGYVSVVAPAIAAYAATQPASLVARRVYDADAQAFFVDKKTDAHIAGLLDGTHALSAYYEYVKAQGKEPTTPWHDSAKHQVNGFSR